MDNRPIGVFDSGLGGLTAVKALRRMLPGEDIVYFGDTGRIPYGTRSRETIVKYAGQDIRFLQSFDVKMIVVDVYKRQGKPAAPVSTLEGLAYNLLAHDGIICPVMDARCQQMYTALFACRNGELARLMPDSALPLSQLADELARQDAPVLLVGDGARLCRSYLGEALPQVGVAPAHLLHQRASSVAMAAAVLARKGELCSAAELGPVYLRLPQAERELLARRAASQTNSAAAGR